MIRMKKTARRRERTKETNQSKAEKITAAVSRARSLFVFLFYFFLVDHSALLFVWQFEMIPPTKLIKLIS
jgi:hypothetical protein